MAELVMNPEAKPAHVDAEYAELRDIRIGLEALPDNTRVDGATKADVIGALFGVKTKAECRRVCREAFGV